MSFSISVYIQCSVLIIPCVRWYLAGNWEFKTLQDWVLHVHYSCKQIGWKMQCDHVLHVFMLRSLWNFDIPRIILFVGLATSEKLVCSCYKTLQTERPHPWWFGMLTLRFIAFVSPYRFHIRPSSYCVIFAHDYHIRLKGKKTWNPWGYLHFWMAPTIVSWQNVLGIHPVKDSWNSKKSQDIVLPPGLWYRFDRAIKLSQQAQHLSFMVYINCDCTGRPHHVYDVRIWQDAYG